MKGRDWGLEGGVVNKKGCAFPLMTNLEKECVEGGK